MPATRSNSEAPLDPIADPEDTLRQSCRQTQMASYKATKQGRQGSQRTDTTIRDQALTYASSPAASLHTNSLRLATLPTTRGSSLDGAADATFHVDQGTPSMSQMAAAIARNMEETLRLLS